MSTTTRTKSTSTRRKRHPVLHDESANGRLRKTPTSPPRKRRGRPSPLRRRTPWQSLRMPLSRRRLESGRLPPSVRVPQIHLSTRNRRRKHGKERAEHKCRIPRAKSWNQMLCLQRPIGPRPTRVDAAQTSPRLTLSPRPVGPRPIRSLQKLV